MSIERHRFIHFSLGKKDDVHIFASERIQYDFIFAFEAKVAPTLLRLLLTLIYNGPLYIDTCVSWCNVNRLLAFTSDSLYVES